MWALAARMTIDHKNRVATENKVVFLYSQIPNQLHCDTSPFALPEAALRTFQCAQRPSGYDRRF